MTRFEESGVRWEIQSGSEPVLKELLLQTGQVVKQSPVKLVTAHTIGRATFYVKRYLHSAVSFRPFKFFFKPSQARQEWELAHQLESLGIAIVRHVALGERWGVTGLKESILVTEGFDGVPLDAAANVDPAAVLAFVTRMHDRGVLQTDLHPGNILWNRSTGEMRLVDLHGTRITSRVSEQERARNLALLRIAVPVPVSAEVEQLSARERRRRLAYRSKRCLKHNREFAPRRLGGLRWRVRLPFFQEPVRRILEDPNEFFKSRAEILKPGRTSTVGRADGLVLKRFNFRKLENLVKDWFRPSRAYRAYRKAYHLELVGIPTARPIAAAEKRILGFLRRSYLLMEEIPGAVTLGDWLTGRAKPSRVTIRQAAELIGRLHDEGFSHRDLKESNLVLGRAGELYLLDLDGVSFMEQVPTARAAADLTRLGRDMARHATITRAERFCFLRRYCEVRGLKRVPRLP